MQRLQKTKQARLLNVDTYKLSCENNELIGKKSLKSAEESDDFVHVIQSVLTKYNASVVVKIHEERDKIFLQRELQSLKKLINFQNSVRYICDFSCLDDKDRWFKKVTKDIKFCKNVKQNEHQLHFIVMEYIENGDLHEDFFDKNPPRVEILSVFLQIALAIAILGFEYKIYHGDLHSGNILLSHTNDEFITYNVLDKSYNIKTYGYLPKLADYGRSGTYDSRITHKDILEDIYMIFTSMSTWIKDIEYKDYIKDKLLIQTSNFHKFMKIFM